MALRLFVTGTDTGVGKTHVSVGLCAEGVARGWAVFGHKPVETGCRPVPEDATALATASGGWQVGDALCQYAFDLPAAPLVAARAEQRRIDLDRVIETIARHAEGRHLALVEGAGGWRVPLTESEDMSGLARRLGWPVLIVARAGLGTINHSLLTAEAVAREGCEVRGVVLSRRPDEDAAFTASNRDEIARRLAAPVWVVSDDERLLLDRLLGLDNNV